MGFHAMAIQVSVFYEQGIIAITLFNTPFAAQAEFEQAVKNEHVNRIDIEEKNSFDPQWRKVSQWFRNEKG